MRILFSLIMLFSWVSFADDLTLYFIPSPQGLNWKTPTRLLRSVLGDNLTGESHDIGHVEVEFNCSDESGQMVRRAAGIQTAMTGASSAEIKDVLFKQKIGFGLFFHTFAGHLQTASEIDPDLTSGYANGRLAFVTFAINNQSCQRLAQYFDDYSNEDYGRCYGLSNRPRYREGGGCSAFAESFVELAGLMDSELAQAWSRVVAVPDQLIGGKMTGNSVPVWQVLLGPTHWATASEASHRLLYWEPDLMVNWVKQQWNLPRSKYTRRQRGKALGLFIDQTNVPTPIDPIWLEDSDTIICGSNQE